MIIYHLNVAIDWYQRLASANESAGQASDTFYFDNARSLSKQAIQLAFESAEAEAELLAAAKTGGAPGAPLAGSEEAEAQSKLAAAAANAADHLKQVQTQIDEVDKQLPRVSGKKRQELTLQRENLQAELALDEALQDAVQKLLKFAGGGPGHQTGLQAEINQLKKSVPDVFMNPTAKAAKLA